VGTKCDWRVHVRRFAACGHLWCETCKPDELAGRVPCAFCEDAYDAADELADLVEAS